MSAPRRQALYGKKSGTVPGAETEGKEVKPKLTGGDRAENVNPYKKAPKVGGK